MLDTYGAPMFDLSANDQVHVEGAFDVDFKIDAAASSRATPGSALCLQRRQSLGERIAKGVHLGDILHHRGDDAIDNSHGR